MNSKKILITAVLVLSTFIVFAQKGVYINLVNDYRYHFAVGNLGGSTNIDQNYQAKYMSPNGSYADGIYYGFGIGYATKKNIEFGIDASYKMPAFNETYFTYQEDNQFSLGDAYVNSIYKGSLIIASPYIRLRKKTETRLGKIISPYIKIGLVTGYADVVTESYYKEFSTEMSIVNNYHRGRIWGINGAMGYYVTFMKHWQMFAEVAVTGMSFKPKKVTSYRTIGAGVTETFETDLNDKSSKIYSAVSFPFSSWGTNIGFRFNFIKVNYLNKEK